MFGGIAVVFDEARLSRKDGVVSAHIAVLAWKPVCPALTKNDVSWYDKLFYAKGERNVLVSPLEFVAVYHHSF